MTKMIDFVDDMRARLTEVATTEQTLIQALGDALASVDQQLLADVRDLTLAHEARRVAILSELQTLAARIGAFPVAREAIPTIEDGAPGLPPYVPPTAQQDVAGRSGDWRQAASNIAEEVETRFGRRGPPH